MKLNKGFLAAKPELILFLGAGPAVALTAKLVPAMGMGVAMITVMLLTNLTLALLKKAIPAKAQVPAILIVAAFWTGMVQMVLHAVMPNVYSALGVYLAAAAVNLLVVHEGEQTLKGRSVGDAIYYAVKTGLILTFAMIAIAIVREIFGSASIADKPIAALEAFKIPMLAQAPGGFGALAVLIAICRKIFPAKEETAIGGAVAAATGEDEEVGA